MYVVYREWVPVESATVKNKQTKKNDEMTLRIEKIVHLREISQKRKEKMV